MTSPELLAPAGEPRALRAALSAGADAVYFGLARWSARAFAGNFGGEAVPEAVETAHLYDARAYLALNTLLKDDEVEPALAALEAPYLAGLDALIVADLGFAARVREEYPELPLHASTQLNTHSSAQLAALERLGFSRAILARELSLAEIAALDDARPRARGLRPRGPLLRLLRRLPAQQHGRRPQRQPRPLQPVVPAALRPQGSRPAGAGVVADHVDQRPVGDRRAARPAGRRRHQLQGRGPHEGRRLRRRHDRRVPRGARRGGRGPGGLRRAAGVERAARAELLALVHHGPSRRPPRRRAQRRPRRPPRRARRPGERLQRVDGRGRDQAQPAGRRGRRRLPVHALGPDGAAAPGGGRRRGHHAARARARRRQGPALPAGRRRRGRAGPRPRHRARRAAPDRPRDAPERGRGGARRARRHRPWPRERPSRCRRPSRSPRRGRPR